MAKKNPAKKPRWYKLIAQAFRMTYAVDKAVLPIMLLVFIVPIGLAVVVGLSIGGPAAMVYAVLLGLMIAVLATLFTLTRRFETAMFKQMEGQLGGSVSVAQSIRTGWQFAEEPIAIDPKGKSVVFQGVGRGGVVLLVEGGAANAAKQLANTERRIARVLPGVPVNAIYVGTGADEVPLRRLVKAIKKHKKVLSKREVEAVSARLRALGVARLPVPKGIDPLRARPDRKAVRGK